MTLPTSGEVGTIVAWTGQPKGKHLIAVTAMPLFSVTTPRLSLLLAVSIKPIFLISNFTSITSWMGVLQTQRQAPLRRVPMERVTSLSLSKG